LASGKSFSNSPILEAEQKLAALDDVAAEQTRLAREESAKAHQAEVTAVRTEIADLAAASTKALAEAEASLRKAVAAQRLVHQHEKAKRQAQARLNNLVGSKEPILSEGIAPPRFKAMAGRYQANHRQTRRIRRPEISGPHNPG